MCRHCSHQLLQNYTFHRTLLSTLLQNDDMTTHIYVIQLFKIHFYNKTHPWMLLKCYVFMFKLFCQDGWNTTLTLRTSHRCVLLTKNVTSLTIGQYVEDTTNKTGTKKHINPKEQFT